MSRRIKAFTLGLGLELESDLARDYIEQIYDAFRCAGADIPKYLNDALLSIEYQLGEE